METPTTPPPVTSELTDIVRLRLSGIFPKNREPSIRTLRNWTRLRRIPHHKVGHLVCYDPSEVAHHMPRSREASSVRH